MLFIVPCCKSQRYYLIQRLVGLVGAVDHLLVFLAGKSTEQEVINAADNKDDTLKQAQLCEAFYFCGEKRTVAADVGGARQDYQQAIAT